MTHIVLGNATLATVIVVGGVTVFAAMTYAWLVGELHDLFTGDGDNNEDDA